MMDSPDLFRERAKEAREDATTASDPTVKMTLHDIANRLEELAVLWERERERRS